MTDYGYQHDCHVIDWWLHQAARSVEPWAWNYWHSKAERHSPDDWTRYDGELL